MTAGQSVEDEQDQQTKRNAVRNPASGQVGNNGGAEEYTAGRQQRGLKHGFVFPRVL